MNLNLQYIARTQYDTDIFNKSICRVSSEKAMERTPILQTTKELPFSSPLDYLLY